MAENICTYAGNVESTSSENGTRIFLLPMLEIQIRYLKS